MKTDIEIAQEATMKPITEIAAQLGLADEDVIPYGRYKAKINHRLTHSAKKQGKLILVTAISPTPAGEGKTTTSVGLADAMNALGKKTMLCLREPSLGPVFGIKGGAAGGGYAQVVPMEDINLHFTGDLHAIGTANNLLAAMIDNSIQQGNPLHHLEALHGHERPSAPLYRGRPGRQGQRHPPRGRLRHHRRQRDHGHLLPCHQHLRLERAPL